MGTFESGENVENKEENRASSVCKIFVVQVLCTDELLYGCTKTGLSRGRTQAEGPFLK